MQRSQTLSPVIQDTNTDHSVKIMVILPNKDRRVTETRPSRLNSRGLRCLSNLVFTLIPDRKYTKRHQPTADMAPDVLIADRTMPCAVAAGKTAGSASRPSRDDQSWLRG